ncbi:MAG: hypothetical protein HYV13_03910 [Candidatus Doudnabacteria bacterium]|nr:hypothetical protein [Candidatus Doudnabacteria bacterium]
MLTSPVPLDPGRHDVPILPPPFPIDPNYQPDKPVLPVVEEEEPEEDGEDPASDDD